MTVQAYTRVARRWQVSWFESGKELAQVTVDDRFGAVTEAWTGYQVAWRMARGYPGAFGRSFNAIYVWLPLGLLFLAPFIDPRRPVPAPAPRPAGARRHSSPRTCSSSRARSAVGAARLSGARLPVRANAAWRASASAARPPSGKLVPFVAGLAARGSRSSPGGLPGGAQHGRLERGRRRLLGRDRRRPDRARPAALRRQLPDRQRSRATPTGRSTTWSTSRSSAIWPWGGTLGRPAGRARGGDRVRPAHAARPVPARAGGCAPGRAGRELGSCSRTPGRPIRTRLFALESNCNDTLVAMFARLRAAGDRVTRSAAAVLTGLAAAAKFVSLALGPLFARGAGTLFSRGTLAAGCDRRGRGGDRSLPFIPDGGIHEIWHRTLGYQVTRPSPFSIWGQARSLDWLHTVVKVMARRARGARGVRPAAAGPGDRRGPRRGGAAGVPAGRRPLVLPLHRVVRAVRARGALRAVRAGHSAGSRICSIERASPSSPASISTPITHGSSSDVSNLHRHHRHEALEHLLALHADHAAARAGHAHVADVGGAAREHARVGGGHVRVGAHAGGHAAVEVPAHRHLLARGLRVEVHEDPVGLAAQLGQDRVGLAERRAGGVEEHGARTG